MRMRAEVASSGSTLAALAKQGSGASSIPRRVGCPRRAGAAWPVYGAASAIRSERNLQRIIARPFSVVASGWPAADEPAT